MKKSVYLILITCSLAGCSIYKSNLRKSFETDSSGRIKTASFQTCTPIGTLQAWLEADYANESRELLISDNGLEAWKTEDENGSVFITSLFRQESGVIACTWSFANSEQWFNEKQTIINEIKNTLEAYDENAPSSTTAL